MKPIRILALAAPTLLAGAALVARSTYRAAMRDADLAWQAIASRTQSPTARFDPAMVEALPEVARRYFRRAIAPGTPLATTVELEMEGTFLLGDAEDHQSYRMEARQILRPPHEFVWIPRLSSGAMRISGSDALVGAEAWTRFFLLGLVPVAAARTSAHLLRSAAFRSAVEGIWAPAALLPANGVDWEQVGPDRARLIFRRTSPEIAIDLELALDGTVSEVAGLRWSNANPEQSFRLQPFGGTVVQSRTFEGFTIPAHVRVGNHYGTSDYLPFFQARIVRAVYR